MWIVSQDEDKILNLGQISYIEIKKTNGRYWER